MDNIFRDSVYFTTVLHCVLAYSLTPIVANKPGTYSIISPVPQIKVLNTPSYTDQIPQTVSVTPSFMVNPSWDNKHSLNKPGLGKEKEKSIRPPLYKPERPGTALKGTGLKYPLITPRVKLTFLGTSGMLPVKQIKDTPSDKLDTISKALKPTGSDISKHSVNDKRVGRVELHKNVQAPIWKLDQNVEQISNAANINNPRAYSDYGQIKQPLNAFQFTPSYKPEQPNVFLNPTSYPQTNPGLDYGNGQEVLKNIQNTPTYEQLALRYGLNLPGLNYASNTGEKDKDPIQNNQYIRTSTHIPDSSRIESLKRTNSNYPSTNHNLYYGKIDKPKKANQKTPSYETYVPAIHSYPSTKAGAHGLDVSVEPYKAIMSTGNYNADNLEYSHTMPGVDKESAAAVELPPVPTTISLLRRTQITLLNTVAGLPGGNPQALEALRAT